VNAQNGEETRDTADYIAAMTGALAAMARRNGLETVGYLLEMACLEAQNASDGSAKRSN
jgi:hypothetical protein